MDKELTEGGIGAEAGYAIDIVGGDIKLEIKYDGAGADAGVYLLLDSGYFLDKLAEKIPGDIDDAVIGIIKAAFKG